MLSKTKYNKTKTNENKSPVGCFFFLLFFFKRSDGTNTKVTLLVNPAYQHRNCKLYSTELIMALQIKISIMQYENFRKNYSYLKLVIDLKTGALNQQSQSSKQKRKLHFLVTQTPIVLRRTLFYHATHPTMSKILLPLLKLNKNHTVMGNKE